MLPGSPSDGPPFARPTRVRWLIFGLACAASWLLYLHRYLDGEVGGARILRHHQRRAADAVDDVRFDHGLTQGLFYGDAIAGEPRQPVGGDVGTG